jgi:hypothetical protein
MDKARSNHVFPRKIQLVLGLPVFPKPTRIAKIGVAVPFPEDSVLLC